MKDQQGKTLYVGKSKSIRTRVRSYFAPPVRLEPKTSKLVSQIKSIDYIEVASELESLLLESRLIKKFRPHYNIASKDDKSPYYIHITHEDYPKPIINHDSAGGISGPFLNRYIPSRILKQLRHIAPYCLAPRPVKKPCLYSHLGLCHPCPAKGDKAGYLKNIVRLKKLLQGQFSSIKKDLAQGMLKASSRQDFETASIYRDQLQNLNRLKQTPISPDFYIANPNLIADQRQQSIATLLEALGPPLKLRGGDGGVIFHRIEFYDNAHLSGSSPTSAMTVAIDGQITPREYRHFTLKTSSLRPSPEIRRGVGGEVLKGDDVEYMRQVITRRLKHTDWPTPDLIVLDGGLPQLSVVKWNIPTIALAKREEIIYTPTGHQIKLDKFHPGLKMLMHLRDEAHRFSRRLHFKHRTIKMLN